MGFQRGRRRVTIFEDWVEISLINSSLMTDLLSHSHMEAMDDIGLIKPYVPPRSSIYIERKLNYWIFMT